jgi:SPP1 family predicted phage head-tail adaptor
MDPWPSLDPGDLRNQISILQQTQSSDASGNTVVMAPFATAYAKIDPVRGTDVLKAGQVTTQEFLVISMWYQPGILADMQVQALNGLYVIQGVEDLLEMDIVLKLNCLAIGRNDA